MSMTLRQLEYLEALAETLHFGKAARRCGVSQPALSVQIHQLEEHLGMRLLERRPRQVLLTNHGREVLGRAKNILRELKDIEALAHQARRPLHGSIRMGVIPTIAPYLLPKILPELQRRFSELKLYLREDQTHRILRQLEQGELDVLLLALPIEAPGILARELFKERFLVALPTDHTLAPKKEISVEDLIRFPLLLLEDGHCLRDQALEVCSKDQALADHIIKATSLNTLVEMVASGLGITLIPELAVPAQPSELNRIAIRPFTHPQPWRSVGLLWREQSGNQQELRMLGDFLQAHTQPLLHQLRSQLLEKREDLSSKKDANTGP
ncbi:MAG: LysR substrate-binding domain-containing protein [Verrucomicrobiota bacterium]|nr:LysR substrate-binding domain-containing protein [Verrucomicrobiota bacterium]